MDTAMTAYLMAGGVAEEAAADNVAAPGAVFWTWALSSAAACLLPLLRLS